MKHLYEYINEIMDIASVNHAEPQNAKDMFLANVRNAGDPTLPHYRGAGDVDYAALAEDLPRLTRPGNLWGQICLPFSALWALLAGFAVVLDDWLRYWMFGEDRPHYVLF